MNEAFHVVGRYGAVFRYGIVGLLVNAILYGAYWGITYWSVPSKIAMTMVYLSGAILGFFANRRFTFRHDGHIGSAGLRFMLAHALGYLLNLALLVLFVDLLGFAHQLVQAVAIVVVAAFLFVLFRGFVFVQRAPESGVDPQ
ncbi:GtrA family protein [Pseudomonas alcaligenes]|uniref:GtrA family protein n=1 Tax=Aquipseudomonas alcaligenes TaxID=43263 RepID=UPI002E7C2D5B|nr:GtrA family protein [Pseudomonas alcaligenes]MEE1950841.1 GtrA family protein [Pseudomonas alcaligenes]